MERVSKEIIVDKGELYLLSRPGEIRAEPASSSLRQRIELQSLLTSARRKRFCFYVRLTPLTAADVKIAIDVVVELARCGCTASLVSPSCSLSPGAG